MSFTDELGDPISGDNFKNADHLGKLIAFIHPEEEEVATVYGDSKVAKCRYAVIIQSDQGDEGDVYDEPMIFGNMAKDVYSGGRNKVTVGRITQGDAKPGQNPPFILKAADDAEKALAGKWLDANAVMDATGAIKIG